MIMRVVARLDRLDRTARLLLVGQDFDPDSPAHDQTPSEAFRMKVQVIFYSMYGHIYLMSEAIAEGARQVEGAEVTIAQVPELVPEAALEMSGAKAARAAFAHIPV